jgi:hypothetical protein
VDELQVGLIWQFMLGIGGYRANFPPKSKGIYILPVTPLEGIVCKEKISSVLCFQDFA